MAASNDLNTNIAILGGGPAGYVAAIRAAQLGAEVVLIEEKELGGVCLNQGCIPTKSFLKNAEAAHLVQTSKEYGIDAKIQAVDWHSAWLRKERVVKNSRMGVESLIAAHKIILLKGRGYVENPREIRVETGQESVRVSCRHLIITVGSEPLLPKIPGIDLPGVLTSNEALEFKEIPRSLVIVGAGVIGLEFADMFNSIGTKVTVLEMENSILPKEDREIGEELLKVLKRKGIGFKLGVQVKKIEEIKEIEEINEISDHQDQLKILFEGNRKETVLKAEKILVAAGRRSRTYSSDLIALGLEIEHGAIAVNEKMATNVPSVYAAGDVIGGKLLAHLAYAEGRVAVENALGRETRLNYDTVPTCTYTHPEIATVGIGEEEAAKRGIKVLVGRFELRHNSRAMTLGERDGFVKVVVDRESGVILGGQILGSQASEMISELTLAVTLGVKAEIIAEMMHPHPTLSEAIMEACGDALGRSIHKVNEKN
ncbi:dihydrolipoyl dehydrogenase [Dehalobacterium formicoaceticum]|uniref:Dihydrolipoyl dehydrogenase n=1 Tax=Dehalobacterium formicoaceticum TaxID=51515 RepID=A0ABT1Y3E4_9FIRM|nr:dihydrolipoyl dehydrogenase [Dehalobacterium formicoaceticum]MCR6544675.1 dihydrolipoyl dehydrogenase [Dehalobacterium formicoaceticum]